MKDEQALTRFVEAQRDVYEAARRELQDGRKRSHWMWFVFPQMRGLGRSAMADHYGVASLAEARAYLRHPVLGPRLRDCARLVLEADAPNLRAIFGSPDDLKFASSMTLFEAAAGADEDVFARVLDRWCGGERDARTLELL